jgi:hypothetical protein
MTEPRCRFSLATCAVAFAAVLGAPPVARADHGPVVVIPGRADVPVIVNGVDAGWSVVEGDWGLYRPGHGRVVVEGGWLLTVGYPPPGYFPSTGRRPRVGRREILPRAARRGPVPAESFYRAWSAESGARPATDAYPSDDPPPVIMAPRFRHGR